MTRVLLPKTTYNTFVELILIERILFNPPSSNEKNINKSDIMSYLSQSNVDENQQQSCYQILSLIKKYKLKKYLNNHYDDSHCVLIELIFKHIIMKHYTDEYQNQVSMISNNNNNNNNMEILKNNGNQLSIDANINNTQSKYFECILFNQGSLIPQIFQYLELNDINNCSKVNLIWLIHAFDDNSLNDLNFHLLIKYKYFGNDNKHCGDYRIWQRCSKVKRVEYNNMNRGWFSGYYSKYFDFGKNLAFLRNVNTFSIQFESFSETEKLFLKALESTSGNGIFNTDKIVHFEAIYIPPKGALDDKLQLPLNNNESIRLQLANVKIVKMYNMSFNIKFSNKCERLHIGKLTIDASMIKNCDLSGIKTLTIDTINIGIGYNYNYARGDLKVGINSDVDPMSIGQRKKGACNLFAQKLSNIKEIGINGPGRDTLLLWKAIQACKIISKNECDVYVSFAINHKMLDKQASIHVHDSVFSEYDEMTRFIDNNNDIRVTDIKLCLDRQECVNIARACMISSNICRNIQVIRMSRFYCNYGNENLFSDYIKYLNDVTIKVSQVIEEHFVNLRCIDCDFIFWDELDWTRFCNLFDTFTKIQTFKENSKEKENENKNESKIKDIDAKQKKQKRQEKAHRTGKPKPSRQAMHAPRPMYSNNNNNNNNYNYNYDNNQTRQNGNSNANNNNRFGTAAFELAEMQQRQQQAQRQAQGQEPRINQAGDSESSSSADISVSISSDDDNYKDDVDDDDIVYENVISGLSSNYKQAEKKRQDEEKEEEREFFGELAVAYIDIMGMDQQTAVAAARTTMELMIANGQPLRLPPELKSNRLNFNMYSGQFSKGNAHVNSYVNSYVNTNIRAPQFEQDPNIIAANKLISQYESNSNYNDSKCNILRQSLFWNVYISMYWPQRFVSSKMRTLFGYVKKLCQCANESYIKLNNPINFKIEFIAQLSHSESYHMEKIKQFNKKATQMEKLWNNYCKDDFVKTFDNLVFIIQDNCILSNEKYQSDIIGQMKASNDKCQPLPKCYVWCKYTLSSNQCKIEFVMKNALYKD